MKIQAASISRPDTFRMTGTDRVYFNGQVSGLSNQDETVVMLTQSKKAVDMTFALFGNMTEGSTDGDITGVIGNAFGDAAVQGGITDSMLDDTYADMEREWKNSGANAAVSASSVSLFANGTVTVSAVGDGAVVRIRDGQAEFLYGVETEVRGIGIPSPAGDATTGSTDGEKARPIRPFLLTQESLPGDTYIVISKAVREALSPTALLETIAGLRGATEIADTIMDELTRKNVPGDQSVIVCRIAEEKAGKLSKKMKLWLLIGTAAALLLALGITLAVIFSGKTAEATVITIENYTEWERMTVGDEVVLKLKGNEADYTVHVEFDDIVKYDAATATLKALKAGTTKIAIVAKDGASLTKSVLVKKDSEAAATTTVRKKTESSLHIPDDVGLNNGTKETKETSAVSDTTAATTKKATETKQTEAPKKTEKTTDAPPAKTTAVTTTRPEKTEPPATTAPVDTKKPDETTAPAETEKPDVTSVPEPVEPQIEPEAISEE